MIATQSIAFEIVVSKEIKLTTNAAINHAKLIMPLTMYIWYTLTVISLETSFALLITLQGQHLSIIWPNMRHKACLEYITPPLWPEWTIQTQLKIQKLLQPPISKMKKKSKSDFPPQKQHTLKHVIFLKMAKNDCLWVYFSDSFWLWGIEMKYYSKRAIIWKSLRCTDLTAHSYTVNTGTHENIHYHQN